MKYLLYTTSSSLWYQERCDAIAKEWSRIRGAEPVEIEVRYKVIPNHPDTIVDKEGHTRFSWDWFEQRFDDPEYDGIFFHLTDYYKRKWWLSKEINGTQNSRRKDKPMFWLCSGKELAEGYEFLYEFDRLMYHEMAHFYENLDDDNGNLLTQDSVHDFDYRLQKIHYYHHLVDLRWFEFRRQVNRLMVKVINIVKKHI